MKTFVKYYTYSGIPGDYYLSSTNENHIKKLLLKIKKLKLKAKIDDWKYNYYNKPSSIVTVNIADNDIRIKELKRLGFYDQTYQEVHWN